MHNWGGGTNIQTLAGGLSVCPPEAELEPRIQGQVIDLEGQC